MESNEKDSLMKNLDVLVGCKGDVVKCHVHSASLDGEIVANCELSLLIDSSVKKRSTLLKGGI